MFCNKTKKFIFIFVIILSNIAVFIFLEIFFRIVPFTETKQSVFYDYDVYTGQWLIPTQKGSWSQGCYDIKDININSFGMRDRERLIQKDDSKLRVAIFGDSYIEGLQVFDSEVVNQQIEQMLNNKVEVLNFGVSDFGTIQEYIAYLKRGTLFKPDVVILAIFCNDVQDNIEFLLRVYGNLRASPEIYFKDHLQNNFLPDIVPYRKKFLLNLRKFLLRHSFFLKFFKSKISFLLHNVAYRKKEKEGKSFYDVFHFPSNEYWEKAWEVTLQTILNFKNISEKHNAKFLLVIIPEPVDQVKTEKALKQIGGNKELIYFDYFSDTIEKYCHKNNIQCLSLVNYFRQYCIENRLSFPYFSYYCDPHFGYLGHRLMSEVVVDYIRKNNLLNDY